MHSDGATVDLPRPALILAAGAARGSASCGAGFGHGLGSGLETWAGIAMGREEWSEGEEDEGQGQRRRWNDTLS